MKKTQIVIALGAIVLSTAGFLATKANKKFNTVTKAFAGNLVTMTASAGHSFNTIKGSLKTAFFKTSGGAQVTVRTGRTTGTAVAYYH